MTSSGNGYASPATFSRSSSRILRMDSLFADIRPSQSKRGKMDH
jgi:hypothetical protein